MDNKQISIPAGDTASDKAKATKTSTKDIHKGHRMRLRNKFAKHGLDTFTEIEVLEFLLFHVIQRKDTNKIAHLLLDRFGTLKNVLNAGYDELRVIDGMGDVSAAFVVFLREFSKYLNTNEFKETVLDTAKKSGDYCCNYFKHHTNECFIIIGLTHNRKIKFVEKISDGTEYETNVNKEYIFKTVLNRNAKKIILSHNHPVSTPEPSAQDIVSTKEIAATFLEFGIEVIDHIVCSNDDFISMSDRGMI